MILLLLIGATTFSTVNAQLQQSDTIKSGNGTTIININQEPKNTIPPKKDVRPPAPPSTKEPMVINLNLPAQESFISNNGAAWWLIILSLLGMGMLVAILFLVGRNRSCNIRCNCGFNHCNGYMQHNGNVDHNGNINHSGTVEHRHIHPEPLKSTPATPADNSKAQD